MVGVEIEIREREREKEEKMKGDVTGKETQGNHRKGERNRSESRNWIKEFNSFVF